MTKIINTAPAVDAAITIVRDIPLLSPYPDVSESNRYCLIININIIIYCSKKRVFTDVHLFIMIIILYVFEKCVWY